MKISETAKSAVELSLEETLRLVRSDQHQHARKLLSDTLAFYDRQIAECKPVVERTPPEVPLSFNGYHVTFWSHETHAIEEQHFASGAAVLARGWDDGFPTAEDLAENLFNVYGDVVGKIIDNTGVILYEKMADMREAEQDVTL